MKKQKKDLRRLTLNSETIQHLSDPLLGGVLGGALAAHTFTGGTQNNQGNQNQNATLCG